MKKSAIITMFVLSSFLIAACSSSENLNSSGKKSNSIGFNSPEHSSQTNEEISSLKDNFLPDASADFEVVFFDTDNSIKTNGLDFDNVISGFSGSSNCNNCSDCYLIKSSDIEILVDCGGQLYSGSDSSRLTNFCNNIYKKMVTYCTDGILDYLIVTHADSDHLKNLVIDGGFFDSIINSDVWVDSIYKTHTTDSDVCNVFGEKATPITSILNIIDFDSYRVRFDSTNPAKSNPLLSTDIYKQYQRKRDLLINKCDSTYCPASYFFNDVTVDDTDINKITTIDPSFHNYYAMPTDYFLNRLNDSGYKVNFKTYVGTVKNTITNKAYAKMPNKGGLKSYDVEGVNRYTYDLNLKNNTSLRILYNWYYDSYYSTQNGYGQWADNRSGQPENNICVCFLVESGNNKLLITGDLGTYGEDGLLRYYQGTDVLSNVTCFKAAHHGSTSARPIAENSSCSPSENSKKLFDTICGDSKKLNLVVTGVAQPSRSFFEDNGIIDVNKNLYDSIKTKASVALIDKKLFENIGSHNVDVYCTQIVRTNDSMFFYNQPFYGDVHIIFKSVLCDVKYSYWGDIVTYTKRESKDDDPIYTFKTNKTALQNLEWAKLVGLK